MEARHRSIALAVVVAALAAAAAASAARPEYTSVNSYIPARIDATIGFVPSHGMPLGKVTKVRSGGRTYRFMYQNSAVVWPRTSMILSELSKRCASTVAGGFVDQVLTAKQRRRLVVRLDLGRDADVLAVANGHPACAAGVTSAQARGIARGTITRWSQVVPGAPGAIALRVEQTSIGATVPRWAFPISYVVPRRPFRPTRASRAVMRGIVDWLGGTEAAKQLRARGMMLVADGPPEPPAPPAEIPPPAN